MPARDHRPDPFLSNALPMAPLREITGNETLLILAARPGEESQRCGGLIAESCRRGRPPFVMVLGDGARSRPTADASQSQRLANLHDRETRAAIGHLGLANDRLLMAGLLDDSIPGGGPVFDAIVRAVTLVMWARDCNVICAPWPDADGTGHAETFAIAKAVAAGSGVGLLAYATPDAGAGAGWRLDIRDHLAAKRSAVAAHAALHETSVPAALDPYEALLRPGG